NDNRGSTANHRGGSRRRLRGKIMATAEELSHNLSIKELLTKMIELGASDMHLVVGLPPVVRVHGACEPLAGMPVLNPTDTQDLIYSVMNEDQIAEYEANMECDLSFGIKGLSRFRLNVYRDRGSVVAAFRTIPYEILTFDELGLPRCVAD